MKHTFKTILVAAMAIATVAFVGCNKEDNNDNGGTATARYTLTVQPNNAEWGVATGSGSYTDGTRVDIEAVANQGYYFIKWSDGAVSNPRTITVSSDLTLYALFSTNPNDPNPYNPGNNPTPGPNPQPVPDGWVDLGLPSGLLWAECNVGATSPEEYGYYFAWGETSSKSVYNWGTYAYGSALNQLTKYCYHYSYGHNGFTDNLMSLESSDDAATKYMGNGARIPNDVEWQELINNTTVNWTTLNGVYGRKFTASNGNNIFLPAAGFRYDSVIDRDGSYGYYWSSSLYMGGFPSNAGMFYFYSVKQELTYDSRPCGQTVRAVRAR